MKKYIIAAALSLFATPALATYEAEADLVNNQGEIVGHANFKQGTEGVVMRINVRNLAPGVHGMHFHEIGDCSDHAHFKKAEGHIAPTGKPHGYYHEQGPHAGNLPNLIVNQDRTAHVELYSGLVSIDGKGSKPALLDEDGSTLMIHANPDDHITQPIGGSGARKVCGVIRAKEQPSKVISNSSSSDNVAG